MAFISAGEIPERRTGSVTGTIAKETRVFKAKSNSGYESTFTAVASGLSPSFLDIHPQNPYVTCRELEVRQTDGKWGYEVTAQYSSEALSREEKERGVLDPTDRRAIHKWDKRRSTIAQIRSYNGNAIVNAAGEYFDPPLDHNGKPVKGKGFITDDLTDHALQFITDNQSRPFFCYVPFNTPHSPMQVPDRSYQKFANAELKLRARNPRQEEVPFTRAALAMCENIDWNVGRILDRLEQLKLAERTVVIYFSDNGPNGWRWNGGMKGRKGSTDEGGVRSPFMIRWPGHIPAGERIPNIAGAIDLLPTLADLAAIPVASTKPLDGVSLKSLLLGTSKQWADRMIFSHWSGKVSARSQRYRLDDSGQLFDMQADPGQDHDVSRKEPAAAARLSQALEKWSKELLPGLRNDNRPFTVGYAQFPLTPLPARDGVAHGNVRRSAGAPNCSYFKNWTSTNDSMTWDIEVATAGKYEAVIYYACPASDLGSTVQLGFLGSRVEGKLTEANDPPLRGAETDRVPRQSESYVKDFKPWRLGTVELSKGRGLLTLKAAAVAGKQVMEVRSVVLTLLK